MELTTKEQTEVNEFTKKYPTISNIFTILEKRIDAQDYEISELKEETSRLRKYEQI